MATYKTIRKEDMDAAYQAEQQNRQGQQIAAQQAQDAQQVQQSQQPDGGQQNQQAQPTQAAQAPSASGNVENAQQLLQQGLDSISGSYQSKWTEKLNGMLDKIMNREPFQYDLNADALYQMYKDQYVQQGRMAMQDTMGQAAAMTGGYGNSYAQNAGQQAYQGYLQQLTGKIPELYQAAYDRYAQEGQDLYNQYNLMASQEANDYNRFTDERNFQYSKDIDQRDFEYNKGIDERNYQYNIDKDNKNLAQDQVNYLLSLGVRPNDDLLKAAGYDQQYVDEVLSRANAGWYGGGDSGAAKVPQSNNAGSQTTDTIAGTASAAIRAGYNMNEVIKALEKSGVPSARARAAAKQAQIIEDMLRGM